MLEAKSELLRLTKMTKGIFNKVHGAFLHQHIEQEFLDRINQDLQNLKSFERSLVYYLTKVYQEHPSAETSEVLIQMSRITSDLNEIGVTCSNLSNLVYYKTENRLVIDEQVYRGLSKIFDYLLESFDRITKDINQDKPANIEKHIILEEKINQQKNHLRMLQLSKEHNVDLENELLVTDVTNTLLQLSRYLFGISTILRK